MKRFYSILALCTIAAPSSVSGQAFPLDFGLEAPIFALGNTVGVSYYGWEGTTVYGHTLWAFSQTEYNTNLGSGCYNWAPAAACVGADLFSKAYSPGGSDSPYLGAPLLSSFGTVAGSEIIFGIMVNQNDGFNWYFSGDPTRNSDDLAHLAYFDSATFPNGVPGNQGVGVVPQTAGLNLFGFEDVGYSASDWDFDNLIFAIDQDSVFVPQETVPEPATLLLLGSGMSGLAAMRRRRQKQA